MRGFLCSMAVFFALEILGRLHAFWKCAQGETLPPRVPLVYMLDMLRSICILVWIAVLMAKVAA